MKKTVLLLTFLTLAFSTWAQDSSKVVYFSARKMDVVLHKLPLNQIGESEINLVERTPEHAAILLRRTAPGKAEVHEKQADVWYVIDGGCDFVTGGKVDSGAAEGPGEIRGSSISGGEEQHISKGDFILVPAGVPHWVKKIQGKEIVYIVVKYPDAAAH
jgi:mannose-6-phosphate isomerase-like protein (cupin superfamily)